jgi:hypothetical protein
VPRGFAHGQERTVSRLLEDRAYQNWTLGPLPHQTPAAEWQSGVNTVFDCVSHLDALTYGVCLEAPSQRARSAPSEAGVVWPKRTSLGQSSAIAVSGPRQTYTGRSVSPGRASGASMRSLSTQVW